MKTKGYWYCSNCHAKGEYICHGSPGADMREAIDRHFDISSDCEKPDLELS